MAVVKNTGWLKWLALGKKTQPIEVEVERPILAAFDRLGIRYRLTEVPSRWGMPLRFSCQIENAPAIFSASKVYAILRSYVEWRQKVTCELDRRSKPPIVDPVFENLISTWSQLEPSLCCNRPERQQFSIQRRLGMRITPGTYCYGDFEGIDDLIINLVALKNLRQSERVSCERSLKSYLSQIAERRSIEPGSIWKTPDNEVVKVAAVQNSFPYIVLLANKTWISRDLFLEIDDRGLLAYTQIPSSPIGEKGIVDA